MSKLRGSRRRGFFRRANAFKIVCSMIFLCLLSAAMFYGYPRYCEQRDYKNFRIIMDEAGKIDTAIWDKPYENNQIKEKYKVVLVTHSGGEHSYVEYFKHEAEKMGWEVKIFIESAPVNENEILEFNPDFILITLGDPNLSLKLRAHPSRKYLLSFRSFEVMRRSKQISKTDPYETMSRQRSMLNNVHGILTVAKEVNIYKKIVERMKRPFHGIQLYPLVPEINEVPNPLKNLMWISSTWDKHRSSDSYKAFIRLLGENLPLKVYGQYDSATHLPPHVYDGMLMPGMDNLETIQKNGIYLLTHSNFHFVGGEPTMRLFEAASAGALIISDNHPFVHEVFGDSVFYFDHEASAEERYNQVKAHMDWIRKNPEEARAMAAKSHQIYLDKFSLKRDLIRIAKMHEGVLTQERAMGLSHPLGY